MDMVKKKTGVWILAFLLFLILGGVYLKSAGKKPEEMIIITRESELEINREEAGVRLLTLESVPEETESSSEDTDPRISLNNADKKQLSDRMGIP